MLSRLGEGLEMVQDMKCTRRPLRELHERKKKVKGHLSRARFFFWQEAKKARKKGREGQKKCEFFNFYCEVKILDYRL